MIVFLDVLWLDLSVLFRCIIARCKRPMYISLQNIKIL
mgnify:FL=1